MWIKFGTGNPTELIETPGIFRNRCSENHIFFETSDSFFLQFPRFFSIRIELVQDGLEKGDDQCHAPAALPSVFTYWHAALHTQL